MKSGEMGCTHNASSYDEHGGVWSGKRVHGQSVGMMGRETEARSRYKPSVETLTDSGVGSKTQDRLSDNLAHRDRTGKILSGESGRRRDL